MLNLVSKKAKPTQLHIQHPSDPMIQQAQDQHRDFESVQYVSPRELSLNDVGFGMLMIV